MASQERDRNSGCEVAQAVGKLFLSSAIVLILTAAGTGVAQAQTYNVIYTFSGCSDGYQPTNTLAIDRSGSLYGTTEYGGMACGDQGQGVAFRLKPAGSGWLETPIVGPDGSFYGTTEAGGEATRGVAFRIRPPARACTTAICPWSEEVLYQFAGSPDGSVPIGSVVFDRTGKMYGTTSEGGTTLGAVYQTTRSGGSWTENIIYNVDGGPFAGLVVDHAGNLYGVSPAVGSGSGTVFELTPSGSGCTPKVLYSFTGGTDGEEPVGGLVMDSAGNLYGSTVAGGTGGGGTILELSPSGGSWTFSTLYSLVGGGGPLSSLTMDVAGNLSGTTIDGGTRGAGVIWEIAPN